MKRWSWLGLLCVFNAALGVLTAGWFGYWALMPVVLWSILSGSALSVWLLRRSEP